MEKKYKMTNETKTLKCGTVLYRIKAVKKFGIVKKGDLGGWIENEENLSHNGLCWIFGDAMVFDDASVCGNALVSETAQICDHARVYGSAWVCGNSQVFDNADIYGNACIDGFAWIFGDARIYGNARVFGNAWVCGNAEVSGNAIVQDTASICKVTDCVTVGPMGSRNGYTTFYRTRDDGISVSCGCFNGTIERFKKRVKSTYGWIGNPNRRYYKQYITSIKWAMRVMSK